MLKNLTEFGDLLRLRRTELKLKSKELAEAIGIEPRNYSRIELGQVHPTKELCEKLSSELSIPKQKLLILSGLIPENIQSSLNDLYLFYGDNVIAEIDNLIAEDSEVIS